MAPAAVAAPSSSRETPVTAPAYDTDSPTAAPKSASLWEDFIDIFYAPSQVYERRRIGQFGLALVVVMVLTALFLAAFWNALRPMIEATIDLTIRAAAAKGQAIPDAAAAKMRGFGTTMFGISTVVMVPIMILATAFVTWLMGKLLDAQVNVAQAMTIVTYANVPRMLSWLVVGVQGLLGDADKPFFAYLIAPTRFLDPATTTMGSYGLWARLDLFTLWATVLIGIGVAVMARVPRARGFLVAAAVWLLASAMSLFQLARG